MYAILEWLKLLDYKLWRRGNFQWHEVLAEFHEHLEGGSKVTSVGHKRADRQSAELTSLPFILKERKLKIVLVTLSPKKRINASETIEQENLLP
jgi:hypothetical protein